MPESQALTGERQLGLRSVRGGVATHRPGEIFGPRLLEDYELVWIRAGGGTYRADKREFEMEPGTVLLTRPGLHETYVWNASHPTVLMFLSFVLTEIPDDFPQPSSWPLLRLTAPADPLRSLFQWTIDRWFARPLAWLEHPGRDLGRAIETMIYVFLAAAPDGAPHALPESPDAVERALDYMTSLLGGQAPRSASLTEIASAASVSPKYLCRVFQEKLSCSPMEVFRRMRLERSLVLLARSNASMKEIAWRVGFASQYHYSRCFRAAYGQPPSVVRKSLQTGNAQPRSLLPAGVWARGEPGDDARMRK